MRHLIRDLRYAARSLSRSPGFMLGVVLTLALGIGANATMFGVVDTLFLKPPSGVHDAGRVVRVYTKRGIGTPEVYTGSVMGYRTFEDLRDGPGAFASLAASTTRSMSLGRGAEAVHIRGAAVTHEYFPLMGVAPAIGRMFGAAEDAPGVERTAVLSYGFWQRRFGGDRGVLGRQLPIGKGTYTVIGVAAADFSGIDLEPVDLWVPLRAAADEIAGKDALTSRHWWWLRVVGRLKPEVTLETAASLSTPAYRRGAIEGDKDDSTSVVVLGPLQAARGPEAGSDAKVSAWIGGVSLIVLLIACANVANLLLARGVTRRRELAVRAGLGAGRGGLLRLLLAESLVLAALGGVAAIAIAVWGGAAVRGFLIPDLPPDLPLVDLRVLAFTSIAVLITAVLTGILPAIQSSRTDLAEALKSGGRAVTGRGGRTRAALLCAQIALTLTLLVGAGLFIRSLRNVQGLDLGFDANRVVTAGMDLDAAGITPADGDGTYLRALERIQNLPGVEHAAAAAMRYGWGWGTSLRVEGRDSIPNLTGGGPYINVVTPDYFLTLGTRLVRGRGFTATDRAGSEAVAVINQTMATTLWPGAEALGKCLYVGDSTSTCSRIVGVFANARRGGVIEPATMQYFLPFGQYKEAHLRGLVVRSRAGSTGLIAAIRTEIQTTGNLPYAQITTMTDQIAPDYRSWQLGAAAFTAFGVLALVIAAMGIFAVISYSVSQRTQEIGIRMALGAESHRVARMVVAQGLRAAAAGVAIGAVGAYAMGRGLALLLYDVPPGDPLVFAGVAVVLVLVAAASAWLPARRAAAIDPMVALRNE